MHSINMHVAAQAHFMYYQYANFSHDLQAIDCAKLITDKIKK